MRFTTATAAVLLLGATALLGACSSDADSADATSGGTSAPGVSAAGGDDSGAADGASGTGAPGEDDENDAGDADAVAAQAPSQEALISALPGEGTLPAGWIVDGEPGPYDDTGSDEQIEPAQCDRLYNQASAAAGAITSGAQSNYLQDELYQGMYIAVAYHADSLGAATHEDFPALLQECSSFTSTASDGEFGVAVSPVDFPAVGDSSIAYRFDISQADITLPGLIVSVVSGPYSVTMITTGPPPFGDAGPAAEPPGTDVLAPLAEETMARLQAL